MEGAILWGWGDWNEGKTVVKGLNECPGKMGELKTSVFSPLLGDITDHYLMAKSLRFST